MNFFAVLRNGLQKFGRANSGIRDWLSMGDAFVHGVHFHAVYLVAIFGLHRDGVTLANQVWFLSGEAERQTIGDELRLRAAEARKASGTRDISSINEIELKNWHAGNTREGKIGFVGRLQKTRSAIKHSKAVYFTEKR
jgi:hypothetical protein